jgi:hypothetical protein
MNLECLILEGIDRATLKTPNLAYLWMDSVRYLSATSLEHLKELIFESPSCIELSMLPEVLKCTPNLVRLNLSLHRWSTSVDEINMSSENPLLDYPRKLKSLELDGRFLITLGMASIRSLVNTSISEIDVDLVMGIGSESGTRWALAKLKVLLEACAGLKKLTMRPFNPSNARFNRELSLPLIKDVLEVEWPRGPKSKFPDASSLKLDTRW